jgi:hypothetical protein
MFDLEKNPNIYNAIDIIVPNICLGNKWWYRDYNPGTFHSQNRESKVLD